MEVKGLKTYFTTDRGMVKAVDGVDFSVAPGQTLGIVGESGCGKSITSLSVLRLLADNGSIEGGEILFDGKDLAKLSEKDMQHIRGKDISMIFQEPMTSLNPVFRISRQIEEVLILHEGLDKVAAHARAVQLLEMVGIPRAKQVANDYPFQLSGGMRQRVMIAMALACEPRLLIADEPTTALDVTIQAQILKLMNDLKKDAETSIMLITHDMGVVAQMADHVIVMYSGKVVEDAPVRELFAKSYHPYTEGLLASIPSLAGDAERLNTIPGTVPNPLYLPKGCNFAPRCPYAIERCRQEEPQLKEVSPGHKVSCWVKG